MARANKYASVNFNHVYEKHLGTANNTTTTTSSASSNTNNPAKHQSFYSNSAFTSPNNLYKNHLPSSTPNRTHGRMLVLTRPTPKPISTITTPPLSPSPQTPPTHQPQVNNPGQIGSEPESDQISLRPLGRTSSGSIGSPLVVGQERLRDFGVVSGSPKPDKFVPPHLRPGFAGKEERPGPEVFKGKEAGQRQQQQQGHFGSPGRFGEDGRPKSGGSDRMRRGGEPDLGLLNRPGSGGERPTSSG